MASTIATGIIGDAGDWAGFASVWSAANSAFYVCIQNSSTGKLEVYKSANGTSWSGPLDDSNAPTNASATTSYGCDRALSGTIWNVIYFSGTGVRVVTFDTSDDTWDTSPIGGANISNAAAALPCHVAHRSDGDIFAHRTNSSLTNTGMNVWEGATWTSVTNVGGSTSPYAQAMAVFPSDRGIRIIADNQNNDNSYATVGTDNSGGTLTDFDNTGNTTAKFRVSGAVTFNDGTNDLVFTLGRDTGGEGDGYHGTDGATLGSTTVINAVIASTSPQTTSVDTTYFDLGSGNRVVVLWAEANTIKYRATTSAAPAYSFDTEATLIGSLTDTDPCPQWIQNSDAIGALYMDAGSVKVEWLIAPAGGTAHEGAFVSAGTSTAAFAASVAKPVAFTSAGVSSEQIAASVAKPVAVAAAGQATAAFDALIVKSAEVASAGASTAAYAASVAKPVAVTAVAASTATLAASVAKPVAVAATGASTAAFGATVTRSVALAVAATSTAAYAAAVAKPVAFAAAGVSTASFEAASEGVVTAAFVAAGQSAATFAASVTKPVAVAAAGQSAASLAASVSRSASLTVAATSGTTITAAVDAVGALSVAAQSSAVFDAFIGAVLDAFAFDMAVTTTSLDIAITTAQHIIVIEAADLELAVRAGG
jgi:hypothetical protein